MTGLLADRVNEVGRLHADNMKGNERYLLGDLRGRRLLTDSVREIERLHRDNDRLFADTEVKTDLSLTLEKLDGRGIHTC